MSYLRFAAMIATSTVVMFGLMYLNTYAWEHAFFSETRVYMALLMGGCMAIIMLGYMMSMYPSMITNVTIFAGSALVIAGSLWLVRSQATVSQTSYMRAMIPHHSIAIMTSERAQIADPRVRKLAHEIIEAQRREISEMRYLIADLARGGETSDIYEDGPPKTGSVSEAMNQTMLAELDPSPMSQAEIDDVLGPGSGCEFSYTGASNPVFVARAPEGEEGIAQGVTKLNGTLIPFRFAASVDIEDLADGLTTTTEGARVSVRHVADDEPTIDGAMRRWNADLVLTLTPGPAIGYRGIYACSFERQ
ncbi:DUF305 domain-containing protein [Nitratireductor luteus]|uniref:DUF305 domain-containing protein n=1 Tax=Nitratireductor luteus TaxID=2976980 RepID=UPI0022407235|nr:DUF305 domain-containing protein [Nitratireductor luteus]